MFQEVSNCLCDAVNRRENETGKEFFNRSLKTAVKVGGYALAILAGVAILFSLKFTIPFFVIHPTATTGALELASISFTNHTISQLVYFLTTTAALLPAAGWYFTASKLDI